MIEKQPEDETTLDLSCNSDPVCPYCFEVDTDFSSQAYAFPRDDGDERWEECPSCAKEYQIVGNIDITYTSYKKLEPKYDE